MGANSINFTVQFRTRNRSTKGKLPLFVRYALDNKRTELSIKLRITPELWDHKMGRAKGSSQEAQLVNRQLDTIKAKLYDCYYELQREHKLITNEVIKAKFLGTEEEEPTLLYLIEYHNKELKDTIRWGTLKNYFTTEKYVKLFLEQKLKTSDIYLSQLSYKFLADFEIFLRNWQPKDHQKPMGNNTVMKHIQRFRKLINLAVKMEWLDKDPFVRFKAKYIRKEREFLTEDELATIENKSFDIERLQLVKDLFVFSCYTGLSYSDVIALKHDHIVRGMDGDHWIYTGRVKTGTSVKIPILGPSWEIIQQYKDHPKTAGTGHVLPGMSNQKLNSYLKEIADRCGIRKNLTFHIARHTFATTVTLCNGVPIETVSKLLGHTKLATTQIYARVIEKKISDDMSVLKQKYSRQSKRDTGT